MVPQAKLAGPFPVVKVTDGDTVSLRIDGRIEDVRLVGIDTPEKYAGRKLNADVARLGQSKEELQALGRAATKHTQSLLRNAQVLFENDMQERDRYGRLLAYLYVADPRGEWAYEGRRLTQINLAIVRAGWADTLTVAPNVRYEALYREAARLAKRERRGAWAGAVPVDDTCDPHGSACPKACPVKGNVNRKGARWFHLPGGAYYERTVPEACFVDAVAASKAGFLPAPN